MKAAIILTGAAVLILFTAPVFYRVFNFGNTAGIIFGAFIICFGVYRDTLTNEAGNVIFFMLILVLVFLVYAMRKIYCDGKTSKEKADVIIVLGCRVRGDEPSLALLKRADSAYKFMLLNPESIAVLSGGKGKDELISEAECMRRILLSRGISDKRLVLEDKSTSTDENIRFSKKLLEAMGRNTNRIAVATSEYHQKRAGIICKRYNIEALPQSSHTKPILLPCFLMREIFGIFNEYIKSLNR